MKQPSGGWRVFRVPVAVGALTIAGLVAGLSASEFGQHLCWILVGSPVAVALWVWLRAQLVRRGRAISPVRYRPE